MKNWIPIFVCLVLSLGVISCGGCRGTTGPAVQPARKSAPKITRLSEGAGLSGYPRVAVGSDGVFVAWHDNLEGNEEVRVKRSSGTAWRASENLSNNPSDSIRVDVAAIGNRVGVVWHDLVDGDYDVFFRLYYDGTWLDMQDLSENDSNSDSPRIVDVGDRFAVVWYDQKTGNHQTFIRFSGPVADVAGGGAVRWEEAYQLSATIGEAVAPVAHAPRHGELWVAWLERDFRSPKLARVVLRFWEDLTGWKKPMYSEPFEPAGLPDLATDSDGNPVVLVPARGEVRLYRVKDGGTWSQVKATSYESTYASFVRGTRPPRFVVSRPESAEMPSGLEGYTVARFGVKKWLMPSIEGATAPSGVRIGGKDSGGDAILVWQAHGPQSLHVYTATVPLD